MHTTHMDMVLYGYEHVTQAALKEPTLEPTGAPITSWHSEPTSDGMGMGMHPRGRLHAALGDADSSWDRRSCASTAALANVSHVMSARRHCLTPQDCGLQLPPTAIRAPCQRPRSAATREARRLWHRALRHAAPKSRQRKQSYGAHAEQWPLRGRAAAVGPGTDGDDGRGAAVGASRAAARRSSGPSRKQSQGAHAEQWPLRGRVAAARGRAAAAVGTATDSVDCVGSTKRFRPLQLGRSS